MALTRRAALLAAAATAAAPARAAERDTVTIRIARDIRNMDPANRTSAIESNINKACMHRLIRSKRNLFETELDGAESLDKPDPRTIRFALRPGLVFSHGHGPVTAEDVKFSFERFPTAGPGGGAATRAKDWAALDGVEVTGPLTGLIHLKNPAPTVLTDTLPGGSGCIASRRAFEALGPAKMAQTVVGSGPYMLETWEPNARVVLRANPDFAGERPRFERFVMLPIEDAKTAQLALRTGEIDFTALEPGMIAETQASGSRVIQLDSINYVWVGMNVEAPLLSDIRVRRAIRMGIDPEQVVLAAYNGKAKVIRAVQAPGLLGAWPDAPVHRRDVPAARALLAEAGVKRGQAVRFTILATPAYQAVALVVRALLAEIGLDVQVDARPAGSYWSSGQGESGRALELSLQRFGGQPDPAFQMQWFVSSQVGAWNWQRWRDPEFDRLDAEARATDDTAVRARDYVRMQQLMDESAAFVWLTNEVNAYGVAPWLDPAIQPTGDDLQFPMFAER
jgi:peptide/nickel transport system substrate-binding protein